MSDKHVPLYAEGDVVRHKASKQAALILFAKVSQIHDRSCQRAQPFAHFLDLPPCDCVITFAGEYAVSIGFAEEEEMVVGECVLETMP